MSARRALEENLVLTKFIAEFVDLERLHPGTVQITSTALKSYLMANNAWDRAMPLKRVTIGRVVFEGDTDKELFEKYLVATVTTMADMDGVLLPYEFVDKLRHLIDSIPADEFDGALDDAQSEI